MLLRERLVVGEGPQPSVEALESDLLSTERRRGLFRCGNFGLLLLRQAQASRVDPLLRRMLQITLMRGAPSGIDDLPPGVVGVTGVAQQELRDIGFFEVK